MSLLRADLRVLANLVTRASGRRVLVGAGIGFLLLGMLSWWFAQAILEHPYLLAELNRRSGGEEVHGLLGYGLLACPMVATWLGLAQAQRQLFEAPELLLWRLMPRDSVNGPVQVLLRASFVSACWAAALAGPFVTAILLGRAAPWWAFALLPIAIVGATTPLLAVFLAVQIVLMRFFAGRWLRLCTAIVGALASVGFSTWLLLSLLAAPQQRAVDLQNIAAAPQRLPWTVDVGAELLAAAARGELAVRALVGLLGWLAMTFFAFRLVARLHSTALERHLAAEPPLLRSRRRWPAALHATVRNKELAQLLQQPGAVIGFLVFAVLVFALCKQRVLVAGILGNTDLPAEVTQTAAMLALWFTAVLLVLYAHMGRLALWDGAQWPLYMASPAQPFAILRGKLTAVFLFLLWPLLLIATAGVTLLAVEANTLLVFLGIAIGGTFAALGVLAVVGTLPLLMRPDSGGQIQQGGRSFFAALLLVLGFELTVAPAMFGWLYVTHHARDLDQGLPLATALQWAPWLVLAALGYGALCLLFGGWIASRNYRKLLSPT